MRFIAKWTFGSLPDRASQRPLDPAERRVIVARDLALGYSERAIARSLRVHRNTLVHDVRLIRGQIEASAQGRSRWSHRIRPSMRKWDRLRVRYLKAADSAGEATRPRLRRMVWASQVEARRIDLLIRLRLIPSKGR